jgi:hypothetical protein
MDAVEPSEEVEAGAESTRRLTPTGAAPIECRLRFDARGFEGTLPSPVRVAWRDVRGVACRGAWLDVTFAAPGDVLTIAILPRSAVDEAAFARIEAWRQEAQAQKA